MVKLSLKEIAQRIDKGITQQVRGDLQAFFMYQYKISFDTQGRAQDERWTDYRREPKYEAFKKAITGEVKVLRWKGSDRLYRALTSRGSSDQVFIVSQEGATFGTSLPYADDLMRGGVGPFGEKFPARKFMALGKKGTKLLSKLLLQSAMGEKVPASHWRQRQ